MELGGYANRIARIDLTSGDIKYEGINEEDARKYIGGRGLGVKYVFDNGPSVDPFSQDNILCFLVGPLSGTNVTMSGRMAVVTKSPLTGGVTDSHHGGWSGARLRWAGLDGLIFKGKAKKRVYAYVEGGKVELRDASDLWGKGAHETVKTLLARHGEDVSVISIGQGGENLSRFGNWINENDRASGRGGTGAVGGSKNLKALVIKAKKKMPEAKDRDAFKVAHKDALDAINESSITGPRKGGLSVFGTNVLMNVANSMGALPTKNSQLTAYDRAFDVSGEHVNETILVDNPTCHACPVACKKEVEIREGPYKGLRMESVEYESAWALGANCDNDNIGSIAKIIDQCNDYGLDTIEMGNVLSVYMEATQRGYANSGGLKWGDYTAMVALVDRTGMRVGIGDLLAEGAERVAKSWGHPEIAMTVKGQGIPAYDPRGEKGMGIGYATSNRGACHLRGYSAAAEVVGNVLGPSTITDPLAWKGKGELIMIFQNVHTVTDCLDVCKFTTFAESMDTFAAQYQAITGVKSDANHLLKAGERVYNLERYYNNLAGFREGSDYLPERFLKEPSTMPGSEGHVCELDLMLEEYYEKRGWVNGVVPEAKLKELEII